MTVEKIDVILLCEHVARELDVACALKARLEYQYALRVEIVHQPYGLPAALRSFRPSIVAVPFCYFDFARDYPCVYDWFEATFVNLAWEQLFYPGNKPAKLPRGRFETRHVLHQAWGQFFVDLLRQQGVPPEHIFLNGHPAYQLYDQPYRDYFKPRAELAAQHGLDPNKRWVFFPENYNWAFYKDWRLDEMHNAGGLARANLDAMVAYSRQSFTTVMAWCQALALGAGIELIIRPRPLTPLADFRDAMLQLNPNQPPNLHLTKAESVREWILASDVVISSYSTSLIEAAVAGKPSYIVEPFPLPELLQVEWQQHAARLTTQAEFEAACRGADEHSTVNRLGDWARTTMMARGDAIANLAAWLADLRHGKIRRPANPPYSSVGPKKDKRWMPDRMWFEKQRRSSWSERRDAPKHISPLYETDHFTATDVTLRVNRWAQVLGLAKPRILNRPRPVSDKVQTPGA